MLNAYFKNVWGLRNHFVNSFCFLEVSSDSSVTDDDPTVSTTALWV